jgi:serine/threonine-protein kinase
MTVVKPDNTLKIVTTLLVLVLSSLACMEPVATITPEPTATPPPSPSATAAPSATPTATRTPADVQTTSATVRAALVNVRAEPGGEVIGQVEAGTDVLVIGTDDSGDWVQIAEPAGWLWGGCLEGSTRGCEAE